MRLVAIQGLRFSFWSPHVALFCLMVSSLLLNGSTIAQEQQMAQSSPQQSQYIEEVFVEGQVPDPTEMEEFEIIRYYDVNARGGQLYKMRRYDEAKPLLEIGAQMGFKMSQARLGAIFAYGLGSTPANAVKGISWIGVAAEPMTDPAIRNEYRTLLKQIPQENRAQIEALVASQREKYGSRATGTSCSMIRSAGSHMSWLQCEVDDMYKFRSSAAAYHLCLAQGISDIVTESDGEMGIGSVSAIPCN